MVKKSKKNRVNVIIPAYNESESISMVIEGVRKEIPDSRIIVVDDSRLSESKKTKKAVEKYKNSEVIMRGKKMGRGSAVIEGFKRGLKFNDAKYFFEFDADLAHDSTQMKKFINKMDKDHAGMVIGSRYVKGGKVVNVTRARRLLSKIINRFLSVMLEIKLLDYTSGYRLYRRDAVEFLTTIQLKSTGFITLSEITYKLNKNGFKISETPATISSRIHGKSTMDFRELAVSLLFILRMKIEEDYLSKFYKNNS